MKEINVDSHSVPSTARSKNYRTAQATTTSSGGGGGATTPSAAPTTGGAADTAKVAQNLAEDSTDWAKILRKDIDERTENSLSVGKNITVDGQAILNDVVANTGTFAGLLKAASATITGALLASTVNATTINATTFIGELQGNAATATKLKTARTIWGQSFDGSGNVDGRFALGGTNSFTIEDMSTYKKIQTNTPLSINPSGSNVGIGTTAPTYKLDVNGNARIASDLYADATVGTRNFASRASGWQVNAQGAADFRNIYADELRVQAFTADISQALAGSDYLTKSVSKLSANFVVPAVNSTVRIVVDDIEGMPAKRCFANGDYIRFRAFNRTSGLTIANVWGIVTLDTSFGTNGFSNGTQAYTFTCKATSGAGLTVFKGSEVLDYGTSGSGMISRTTLDAQGSPYEQIATWVNDPSVDSNYTVHARLGNLNGIANCNGYGLYTDNGFFTGKIVIGDLTKNNNFLSFDQVNGLKIKLGGTSVATTTDVSTSVNNIQIGARNLVIGASTPKTITATKPDYYIYAYSLFHLEANKDYIFSCEVDCPTWGSDNNSDTVQAIMLKDGKYSYLFGINSDSYTKLSTGLYRNTYVFQATQSGSYLIRLDVNYNGSTHTFSNVMVAEGNKRTTWTPAPEDVDANIASAQNTANTALSNAASAQTSANTANSAIANVVSDNILSANEKGGERDRWNVIASEKSGIDTQATTYGITTEKTAYDTAFQTLATYLNNGTAWTSGIPNWITDANLSVYTTVVGTTYRSKWQGYFDAKTALLNAIYAKAKVLADNAQGSANTAIGNAATAQTTATNAATAATNAQNSANSAVSTAASNAAALYVTQSKYSSDTTATNQEIQAKVSQTDFNALGTRVGTAESTITQHSTDIASKVSQTTFDALGTRVSTAESTITQHTTDIGLRVAKDGVIGAINLTSEDATIQASKINLIGAVTFSSLDSSTQATINGKADSAAHGNFTYIDGNSVYTGTLTANQVNAVAINANSITTGTLAADRIAGNTITGDKIVANSITGDKLVMNTITALGNVTAGSFNIGSGKFVVDANGNTTTVNMTAVNATISGTLNGVSGTFNYLQGIGSTGRLVFGTYGMTFENEDISQQGMKNNRSLRFYATNIRCRGSFGASSINMARVHDTYIDYYVNGDTNSYVRFNLQSNGVGGYYIPLYPTSDTGYSLSWGNAALGDVYGFPVDLLIFNNSAIYQYEMLAGATGKKVTVINAHDGDILAYLAINGHTDWALNGGKVQTYINIREFMTPSVSSSVHGAGWMLCGEFDNNWA